AAAATGMLAACGNGGGSSNDSLTFQTWAKPVEEASFQSAIDQYMEQNAGAHVELAVPPFPQHYQSLDTKLAATEGPDLSRIRSQQMGHYSQEGALTDLSQYLPQGYETEYAPAFWQAISYEGSPYGLPI